MGETESRERLRSEARARERERGSEKKAEGEHKRGVALWETGAIALLFITTEATRLTQVLLINILNKEEEGTIKATTKEANLNSSKPTIFRSLSRLGNLTPKATRSMPSSWRSFRGTWAKSCLRGAEKRCRTRRMRNT